MDANELRISRLSPSGISLNGLSLNGLSLNGLSLNGLSLNGLSLNGLSLNGLSLNGLSLNGYNLNGLSLNGLSLNGLSLNGLSLNGLSLNGLSLNGLSLNGLSLNGISLGAERLNGLSLNGLHLGRVHVDGINLNGIRLNGLALDGLKLDSASLDGMPLTASQKSSLKLSLSYVAKCALPTGQCVTINDFDGSSTFQLCGQMGLDATWDTDLIASVGHEPAVTACVLDKADNDPANPSNVVSHVNQERLVVKDFFNHAVSCALPAGQCVTALDTDGVTTYQACGSQGLDPAWATGPATQGSVSAQVATCVMAQGQAHGDSWYDYRQRLKTVLKYAVSCALRPDQSISTTDWDGASLTWQGGLGLADWWTSAPLSPAPSPRPTAAGEELVSACLLARTNANGNSVSISLRARPEMAPSGSEASTYAHHEGAFMGNLFSGTPVARVCSGPNGSGWLRNPTTGGTMAAGRVCTDGSSCGFENVGSCNTVCTVKPGVNGETMYDNCSGSAHVINTFLYSVPAFDVNEAAPTIYPVDLTASGATMAASADFNGDGNTDMAIENNQTAVVVRLADGLGGFAAGTNYTVGGTVRAVIARDLDADGNIDLVTANQGSLSVLLGNGNGTFDPATNLTVTNTSGALATVVAADFNNDGKLDLATNLTTGIGLFIGNGLGGFAAQTTHGTIASHGSLVAGDFNGDGKQDLAAAHQSSASVYVIWGNGNGTFNATATTVSIGSGSARAKGLGVGDFNGDGKQDLAAGISVANQARILLGQANNTFVTQTYTLTGGSGDVSAISVAYVDGNATRDLIVSRGSSVVVLTGNAGGTFTESFSFALTDPTSFVIAGHFDRDALWRTDLMVSSTAGRLIMVPGV